MDGVGPRLEAEITDRPPVGSVERAGVGRGRRYDRLRGVWEELAREQQERDDPHRALIDEKIARVREEEARGDAVDDTDEEDEDGPQGGSSSFEREWRKDKPQRRKGATEKAGGPRHKKSFFVGVVPGGGRVV